MSNKLDESGLPAMNDEYYFDIGRRAHEYCLNNRITPEQLFIEHNKMRNYFFSFSSNAQEMLDQIMPPPPNG